MSILNGTIDRRRDLLLASNLVENPFSKTEPAEAVIDRVFVGREHELVQAGQRVVDRPRNLLVFGGYGCGKTTFVRKLLRELHGSRRVRFLTGYAPLRHDSPEGFQLAALEALVSGALAAAGAGTALHDFALPLHQELARIAPERDRHLMPDLRFREGLMHAATAGFTRVVLAIDEVDKRDGQVVQSILMGSRFFLDLDASFVITGRNMDLFGDPRSSLLAAFDHRIELREFSREESREILRKNLVVARAAAEPQPGFLPFEDEVVQTMVTQAKGLPRPLNLMAATALEEAIEERLHTKDVVPLTVTADHLNQALRREGNLIYSVVDAQARDLLARIFRRAGYVSGADLDDLSPAGGLPEALRRLEELAQRDAVLRLEGTDGAAFALSPTVARSLESIRVQRTQLRALWDEAGAAATKQARGRALEDFAAAFFGESFRVVERNLRTDTEEIDLVLEPGANTDPRFRDATMLFVECKNWRDPVDQAVISAFAAKLATRHLQHGFLLTTGSFTADAQRQAVNVWLSMKIAVLLLDGTHIRTFLDGLAPVGELLIERHRAIVLRTK